jgi:hypothetical protein
VGAGSRKGVGRMGEWPRNARSGRAHNRERRWEVREGEVADRWGPRVSEGAYANGRSVLTERSHRVERGNEHVRERIDTNRLVPPGSGRVRGRERVDAVVAERWDSPIRRRGHTRGLARLDWA